MVGSFHCCILLIVYILRNEHVAYPYAPARVSLSGPGKERCELPHTGVITSIVHSRAAPDPSCRRGILITYIPTFTAATA